MAPLLRRSSARATASASFQGSRLCCVWVTPIWAPPERVLHNDAARVRCMRVFIL